MSGIIGSFPGFVFLFFISVIAPFNISVRALASAASGCYWPKEFLPAGSFSRMCLKVKSFSCFYCFLNRQASILIQ